MSFPDIDPYAVLGVQKDAILQDIRTAHRKLVLKCHPDKIKDESQRSTAQDEFQKVQQAYELLSDETRRTKYDQKVRLAELRREMMARGRMAYSSSTRTNGPSAREYRDGRIYEERIPADVFNEGIPFVEEPRTMSRKYEEFGKRQRSSKGAEEKKKTSNSVPFSSARAAKETARDTYSNRAKNRTKERRREVYEKYESAYGESDDDDHGGVSDSSTSSIYVRVKRPSESRRSREATSQKPKPAADSSCRATPPRYDGDYAGEWESKHNTAQDYIRRSRGTVPVENDRRQRSFESAEPESFLSRRSRRSARSSKETVRGASRHGSYEHLEPPGRSYEHKVPSMPTAATSPGIKGSSAAARPSLYSSRSATTHSHSRSKRDSSRSDQVFVGMVYPDGPPRASKLRGTDRYDSGYSSPGTPEMAPGESPSKTSSISTRYKIVTEPETVMVEPNLPSPALPSLTRSRTYSPSRQERSSVRPAPPKLVRSSTAYACVPETSTRYESSRPSTSRQSSSSRLLFNEVEFSARVKDKDIRYAREIGPEHVIYASRDTRDAYPRHHYNDYRTSLLERRQSAYA